MITARALLYLVIAAALAVIFYPTDARASGLCPDWWGTAPLASYHFDRRRSNGQRFNEVNIGIGAECKFTKALRLGFGYYPNSYEEDTFYFGGTYTPWRWKGWEWGGGLLAGTGYSDKVLLSPLPTGAAVKEFTGEWKGWGATVLFATSAVAVKINRDF